MSDEDDVVVPDDLSSLFAPAAEDPSVALVVTPVAVPAPLAAACVLAGVAVDVVPSSSGAIAVLREPASAPEGAAAISKLLRTTPVVLLERREGNVRAVRWTGGEEGDEMPSGLLLATAPGVLEDLLLGTVQAAELEGVVTSVGMSRWKATRLLASSARKR
ncbi:hypothetical protein [Cellulomonas edaphi]|uniref:Uncharacterized protein n=1 Tax=Cellulomonas edaphi TaxID=3053468 RepID=A0ABT7S8T4_9CELL|nr:hypothetical protein [Cellulomons edaphi]MDM7831996.1 hypothetical protein [Cellulomons edaphi]